MDNRTFREQLEMRKYWIDAHHHIWQYREADYPWMSEQMATLRQDFTTDALEQVVRDCGVRGTVAVQARQMLQETQFLLDAAAECSLIHGVVGWIPLIAADVQTHLERFSQNRLLKGVRHVLHDEPDPLYMLREDFNAGIGLLRQYDLRYDLLIFAKHIPQTITFVDRHPNQIFVVDHIAKPRIAEGEIEEWRTDIQALSRRENVFCKLSGMITEGNWRSWTAAQMQPYFDAVLEAFGPSRLMFGSDWPVMTVAGRYEDWIAVVARLLDKLSDQEADLIMQGTATKVYRL
jgi:L-fuconolactonase